MELNNQPPMIKGRIISVRAQPLCNVLYCCNPIYRIYMMARVPPINFLEDVPFRIAMPPNLFTLLYCVERFFRSVKGALF